MAELKERCGEKSVEFFEGKIRFIDQNAFHSYPLIQYSPKEIVPTGYIYSLSLPFFWDFFVFILAEMIAVCPQVCGEMFILSSQMLLFSSLLDGFCSSAFNFENALKVFYWTKSGDMFGQVLLSTSFKSLLQLL